MTLLAPIMPLQNWRDARFCPELIALPNRFFMMGGVQDDKFVTAVEMPRHEVEIRAFALGRTPVTRAEWKYFMGSLPAENGEEDESAPIVNVSYPEVLEFLREVSIASDHTYRLPSEAEWEFACRAGSDTVFPHGSVMKPKDANYLYNERGQMIGEGHITGVKKFPQNAYGFYDMLGNICEWTADIWHPSYDGAPIDGSAWMNYGKYGFRSIRGGAWDHLPRILRPSWRDWAPESARWDNLGFRVARDLTS